ncbi:MAG: hypothetical protein RIC55_22450 [Pirellulaceae bacterium]
MPDPRVRPLGPPTDVPVYNCRVYVAPRNEAGVIVARAANLAEVAGLGESEREALQQIVALFKVKLAAFREAKQEIPWIDPVPPPEPGESERWIAVHL